MKLLHIPCLTLALVSLPSTSWAGGNPTSPITTLFNTGVDAAGVSLADNALELHYTLTAGPVTGTPFVATSANGFPIPPWIGDLCAHRPEPHDRWARR